MVLTIFGLFLMIILSLVKPLCWPKLHTMHVGQPDPGSLLASYRRCHVSIAQKVEPSGGWGSFLFWGKAMYLRSSIRIVSIVNSLFHCARHGSLEASTCIVSAINLRLLTVHHT